MRRAQLRQVPGSLPDRGSPGQPQPRSVRPPINALMSLVLPLRFHVSRSCLVKDTHWETHTFVTIQHTEDADNSLHDSGPACIPSHSLCHNGHICWSRPCNGRASLPKGNQCLCHLRRRMGPLCSISSSVATNQPDRRSFIFSNCWYLSQLRALCHTTPQANGVDVP